MPWRNFIQPVLIGSSHLTGMSIELLTMVVLMVVFYKSEKQSRTETGAALTVLYAKDLEATYERVKSLGGSINKEIFSFPGGRALSVLRLSWQ